MSCNAANPTSFHPELCGTQRPVCIYSSAWPRTPSDRRALECDTKKCVDWEVTFQWVNVGSRTTHSPFASNTGCENRRLSELHDRIVQASVCDHPVPWITFAPFFHVSFKLNLHNGCLRTERNLLNSLAFNPAHPERQSNYRMPNRTVGNPVKCEKELGRQGRRRLFYPKTGQATPQLKLG